MQFGVEFLQGDLQQGVETFRLDAEVATHHLVGDAGRLQPQRERIRLGQLSQRCFESVDVLGRHEPIVERGRRRGLGSRLRDPWLWRDAGRGAAPQLLTAIPGGIE
jgi:hypothetical protein